MAEFTLPKNSRIQSGKHYPAKGAKKPRTFFGIRSYLPAETRTYVPRLLAIRDLVAASDALGIERATRDQHPERRRVIERVRQIPGVTAAGATTFAPFTDGQAEPREAVAQVGAEPSEGQAA